MLLAMGQTKWQEMLEFQQRNGVRSLRSSTVGRRGVPFSTARWDAGLETPARMLISALNVARHTPGTEITEPARSGQLRIRVRPQLFTMDPH